MSNWLSTIQKRVTIKIPELNDDQDLLNELITEAFEGIMNHSQARAYNKDWDSTLVKCVVALYNYSVVEGSTHRSANGVTDDYESSDIIAPLLSRNIPHYIRPVGYVLPSSRFNMPD